MAENLYHAFEESGGLPVLVDFYKDGCAPCRRIAPIISKAEEDFGDALKFVRVNISDCPECIDKFDVEAVPTLIIFKDGTEISRLRGAADAETVNHFIENGI